MRCVFIQICLVKSQTSNSRLDSKRGQQETPLSPKHHIQFGHIGGPTTLDFRFSFDSGHQKVAAMSALKQSFRLLQDNKSDITTALPGYPCPL